MTKIEIKEQFVREILPSVVSRYGSKQLAARPLVVRRAWNHYLDYVFAKGLITEFQHDSWLKTIAKNGHAHS